MAINSGADIHARDREVLAVLAEHRVLVIPQLAALLAVSADTAARRARALAELDLIGHRRFFAGEPAAAWITRRGLGAIESRLPPPRLDLKGYRHDVGVGWLWLAARDGAFGGLSRRISEREMRSHDGRLAHADPLEQAIPYGIGIGGSSPTGLRMRHYPDLLLETSGGRRIAVELELTAKSRGRLTGIMRAYAGDPSIDGVLYLVPDARLASKIEAAARAARIPELVRVQRIAPHGIHGAPQPEHVLTRAGAAVRPMRRAAISAGEARATPAGRAR